MKDLAKFGRLGMEKWVRNDLIDHILENEENWKKFGNPLLS